MDSNHFFAAGARCAALVLATCVALAFGAVIPAAAQMTTRQHSLRVGGEDRTYLLSRPATATGPQPTVIALHAAAQTSESYRGYFGLEATAAREGFVAVYPQGIGRVWNDGRPAAMRLKAVLTPGDDVPFLIALVNKLVAEGVADPTRIYLTGISNGGFMVERMACEYPELFAAYAVIMATAPANYREECKPSRPVPIMFIHGTADSVIAWNGFWTPVGATLSAPDSADLYARLNGCAASDLISIPDREPLDATSVSVQRWTQCNGDAQVLLYRVDRGGHQSPARAETAPDLATPFLGLRNRDIDAGEEIWSFFSNYRLAGALSPQMGTAGPAGAALARTPPAGGVPIPVPSPLKKASQLVPPGAAAQRGISTQ